MRRLLPHRIGALFALVGAAVLAHNGRGSVPTAVLFALVGMAVVVVAVKGPPGRSHLPADHQHHPSRPRPMRRAPDSEVLPMSTLKEIRNRAEAASPGPWMWRGNVDHDDPTLSRYKPGWGRVEVMRHYRRERTADDKGAKDYDEYLRDCQWRDDDTGEFRHLTAEERAERVRKDWLEDQWESPQTDTRLAFAHMEHMHALDARELAVFEVCPEATERTDPRVYRADIVGVRHPDAEFIAHSRQDVTDLLAVIDAVEAVCAKHELGATRWKDPLPVPAWIAEVREALGGSR